jgi:uncharacterized protein
MPKMVIVNTSPIQYLHQLGLIDILKILYGSIYLPQEVVHELEQGRIDGVDLPDISNLNFVEVLDLKEPFVSLVVRDLDKGETAVILNSLENPGSIVVLDDFLARRISVELGLKLTGTAGILIAAKLQGLIDSVSPYLDRLAQLGFYLAPAHKQYILKKAMEQIS